MGDIIQFPGSLSADRQAQLREQARVELLSADLSGEAIDQLLMIEAHAMESLDLIRYIIRCARSAQTRHQ